MDKHNEIAISNLYKIDFDEETILLSFAKLKVSAEEKVEITNDDVEDIKSVAITPEMFAHLYAKIGRIGLEYQEEYKKDIGFVVEDEK